MISVTTETLCLSLPDRFLPSKPLTTIERKTLEAIRTSRLRWIVTQWLNKGIDPKEAQEHLVAYNKTYEFNSRPMPENNDPVDLEALSIAREMVNKRLAKLSEEGIELEPQAIEVHVQQLAKMPQLRERAHIVVAARKAAVRELLP